MKSWFVFVLLGLSPACLVGTERGALLEATSSATLQTPVAVASAPSPGRRVKVTPAEYAGTGVFHTLYLPPQWRAGGPKLPIIFEYTGNYFPASGSTGEVENAGLGFGLTAGRAIWVALPYISPDGKDHQITWWGDVAATVAYAKRYVPQIIEQFRADPNNVFLCGFSRGAIGVNFLGLHDDEVARLWSALITHDHFDGVRSWGRTEWGSPLAAYRQRAGVRLARVGDRPFLVLQNGSVQATEAFVRSQLADTDNYAFRSVQTARALGPFPNAFAKAAHNDRWLSRPSVDRERTWQWIDEIVARRQSIVTLGELVFADRFERDESQEQKDEPGNAWTTSSEKTAGGHKQVDLAGGALRIATHRTANHATSVRHTFAFRDGTLALRFKLPRAQDSLKLNFTDLGCQSVHAGHLFNVVLEVNRVTLEDLKTGSMNLELREARRTQTLTPRQRALLAKKKQSFPIKLPAGTWQEVYAHVDGPTLRVERNGEVVASFSSPGIAHATKTMIRLLVPERADVDDVRIWRRAN